MGAQQEVQVHYMTDWCRGVGVACVEKLHNIICYEQVSLSCLPTFLAVIDAYPNNATVEQGTTLILVCRVVGVPSTTELSYQWTCPGGYCDAGGVDPEWAARLQQGNILVVNVRTHENTGTYTCIVQENTQQIVTASYNFTVVGECQGSDVRTTYKGLVYHYRSTFMEAKP